MANEMIVRLKVLSVLKEPDELTRLIGMECDDSWRKGEPRVKGATNRHDKNGWHLSSGCPNSTPLDEQLIAVLNRLAPIAAELRQLARTHEIEVSCVLYSDHTPALNFSPATIQAVADIGAALDVDLYVTSSEDRSE